MIALAVGRTSEGEPRPIERATFGAINSATIAGSPKCNSTSNVLGLAPSRNLSRNRALSLDQRKRDNPNSQVEEKKPKAFLLLRDVSIKEPQRVFLDLGEQWLDVVGLGIRRSLRPFYHLLPDSSHRIGYPFPPLPRSFVLNEARRGRPAGFFNLKSRRALKRRIGMAGIGAESRVRVAIGVVVLAIALAAIYGDDIDVDGVTLRTGHEGLRFFFIVPHHDGWEIEGARSERSVGQVG
jgi:hypothetical protein